MSALHMVTGWALGMGLGVAIVAGVRVTRARFRRGRTVA